MYTNSIIIQAQKLNPAFDAFSGPPQNQMRQTARDKEHLAALIQQHAKSNQGALITHNIINQREVCAGL